MRLLKDAAGDDEIKSMTSVVNGVSRIAWTALPAKSMAEPYLNGSANSGTLPARAGSANPASNQNKILKNILNALQLKSGDFCISKLDDHSKVAFPVMFAGFTCVYWLYYFISQGDSDSVDVF